MNILTHCRGSSRWQSTLGSRKVEEEALAQDERETLIPKWQKGEDFPVTTTAEDENEEEGLTFLVSSHQGTEKIGSAM